MFKKDKKEEKTYREGDLLKAVGGYYPDARLSLGITYPLYKASNEGWYIINNEGSRVTLIEMDALGIDYTVMEEPLLELKEGDPLLVISDLKKGVRGLAGAEVQCLNITGEMASLAGTVVHYDKDMSHIAKGLFTVKENDSYWCVAIAIPLNKVADPDFALEHLLATLNKKASTKRLILNEIKYDLNLLHQELDEVSNELEKLTKNIETIYNNR